MGPLPSRCARKQPVDFFGELYWILTGPAIESQGSIRGLRVLRVRGLGSKPMIAARFPMSTGVRAVYALGLPDRRGPEIAQWITQSFGFDGGAKIGTVRTFIG